MQLKLRLRITESDVEKLMEYITGIEYEEIPKNIEEHHQRLYGELYVAKENYNKLHRKLSTRTAQLRRWKKKCGRRVA